MNKFLINRKVNPNGNKHNEYDAIIIGAGIGGLTCGCYLAKSGMKVLIAEQHRKIGGYCTSFKRKGFTFDAAVHALGSCREEGELGQLFKDFDLHGKVSLIRNDPSDIIITPDYRVEINNDEKETILQLSSLFPNEKNAINNFISFIVDSSFYNLYVRLKGKSFEEFINSYFSDYKLKSIFKMLAGCLYEPSYRLSALSAGILFKEFIFDGGYYPQGGMQAFSDAMGEVFKEMGGDLLLSSLVTKIKIRNGRVKGVFVNDNFISSNYIVSNCSARATLFDLVGEEHFEKRFVNKIKKMKVSAAPFVTYIGINRNLHDRLDKCCTYWFADNYDIDDFYERSQKELIYSKTYLICALPSLSDPNLAPSNCESLYAITGAPFKNKSFWDKNRSKYSNNIVEKLCKFIPELSKSIAFIETATPITFYNYTLNQKGAFRGWAPVLSNDDIKLVTQMTKVRGLFLTGHWVTQPGHGGIAMVVNSGRKTSELILKG